MARCSDVGAGRALGAKQRALRTNSAAAGEGRLPITPLTLLCRPPRARHLAAPALLARAPPGRCAGAPLPSTACHPVLADAAAAAMPANPAGAAVPAARRLAQALRRHPPARAAVVDGAEALSYARLLARADALRRALPGGVSHRNRVALFLQPQSLFVSALLAAWSAGATAVPLSPLYPPAALAPLLEDADPGAIIAERETLAGLPGDASAKVLLADEIVAEVDASEELETAASVEQCARLESTCAPDDSAMIIFTSGTTGRAKGVVWHHAMIDYQVTAMTSAWRWSPADHVLNVLPLHHIHGLVNVVLTALYNGAHLEMHPSFSPSAVWSAVCRDETSRLPPPSVFMAVPAIYKKLIQFYGTATPSEQSAMCAAASRVRLFVCGSASLARHDFESWQRIAGEPLLERYGMTETGMTLSNLYDQREQGLLGYPLPHVEARVLPEEASEEQVGPLMIRSPAIFKKYFRRPEATAKAFTADGWFDTGDVVLRDPSRNCYRMKGRASTDIIKTGGYKVSAIEIEEVLRECPAVSDCAVVGVPDSVLGEQIVAAIISPAGQCVVDDVKARAERCLPKYKMPRRFLVVDDFPRNVLGKVQKKKLCEELE